MKKRWILPGLLVAAFALAATGLADPGHGRAKGTASTGKFGPYDVVTDDHGSCGNAWAVDTEKRTFTVHKNHDGSYTLPRQRPRHVPDERRPEPGRLRDDAAPRRDRRSRARRAASTATCCGQDHGRHVQPERDLPGRLRLHGRLDRNVLRPERDLLVLHVTRRPASSTSSTAASGTRGSSSATGSTRATAPGRS